MDVERENMCLSVKSFDTCFNGSIYMTNICILYIHRESVGIPGTRSFAVDWADSPDRYVISELDDEPVLGMRRYVYIVYEYILSCNYYTCKNLCAIINKHQRCYILRLYDNSFFID